MTSFLSFEAIPFHRAIYTPVKQLLPNVCVIIITLYSKSVYFSHILDHIFTASNKLHGDENNTEVIM
ncbi:hypothetical protein BIFCAT_01399 [Bifidobacterium catenulatum DSM 16992 = JCM 1194 = LMG 11043]|uniref:Uncharacterized protein n=1 Tax=Bifidobacterium catenulatum DSM 16992 = JCM 1194 = LMG 11043 TaxID=566552 RepID=B6XW12_9BIFI|nr:hypothetical protein BIFCAT_01399 [Bifidobacterium catenulatum DSM 16992 = JCM 1194 = LMG 11043]